MAKEKTGFLTCGIMLLIFFGVLGCTKNTPPTGEPSAIESSSIASTSTTKSEDDNIIVAKEDFPITENSERVPVITGTLSSGVTVRARLYCDRDIDDPGTGSIDFADFRTFMPEDIDAFYQPTWSLVSDVTEEGNDGMGGTYNARSVEYIDENGETITISNTNSGFCFKVGLASLLSGSPDRIPWYSTDYAWQTNDFLFMTSDEAYQLFDQASEVLGIDLSSVCKVDRVPFGLFEAYYRLMISYGDEVPEKEWTQADDAYRIEGAQEWNQLPVTNGDFYLTFDSSNLENEQKYAFFPTEGSAIVTSSGIRELNFYHIYQLEESGKSQPLIPLWDALQTLKNHIDNPTYTKEIMYELTSDPNRDLTIDQIELCYAPIWQGTLGKSGEYLVDMVPCWTFRMNGSDENGTIISYTCVVNAITNEYILQTQQMSSI